jgi:hypothetical protein
LTLPFPFISLTLSSNKPKEGRSNQRRKLIGKPNKQKPIEASFATQTENVAEQNFCSKGKTGS